MLPKLSTWSPPLLVLIAAICGSSLTASGVLLVVTEADDWQSVNGTISRDGELFVLVPLPDADGYDTRLEPANTEMARRLTDLPRGAVVRVEYTPPKWPWHNAVAKRVTTLGE